MGCGHDGCGACGGCGSALELTEAEVKLLDRFAQMPFLPVARRWDSESPVYLADGFGEEYGNAILMLQQKRLIRLDVDISTGENLIRALVNSCHRLFLLFCIIRCAYAVTVCSDAA